MNARLKQLKKEVEKRVGHRIDTPMQKRHYTYARAVYCTVAREMSNNTITHREIGESMKRDHTTVLHNLNVIFPFAMREATFKELYNDLSMMFQPEQESPLYELKQREEEEVLRDRIYKLIQQNKDLKTQLRLIRFGDDLFSPLYEGLSEEEMQEIYDKMYIMVKSIRTRVYR
jgi:Ser-tRNA(Ala) deacylase AlaX